MSCNNCSSCGCETEDAQDVQQFVPGKEYYIGEFFKYGNGIYKVVYGTKYNCSFCDLELCGDFRCAHHERSDSNDVGASLYDSEE